MGLESCLMRRTQARRRGLGGLQLDASKSQVIPGAGVGASTSAGRSRRLAMRLVFLKKSGSCGH